MCQYLNWELNVELGTPKEFKDLVHKDFTGPGPYLTYVLHAISKLTATATNPFPATSPFPSFGPRHTYLWKPTATATNPF